MANFLTKSQKKRVRNNLRLCSTSLSRKWPPSTQLRTVASPAAYVAPKLRGGRHLAFRRFMNEKKVDDSSPHMSVAGPRKKEYYLKSHYMLVTSLKFLCFRVVLVSVALGSR
jgi:hypothetical protein